MAIAIKAKTKKKQKQKQKSKQKQTNFVSALHALLLKLDIRHSTMDQHCFPCYSFFPQPQPYYFLRNFILVILGTFS